MTAVYDVRLVGVDLTSWMIAAEIDYTHHAAEVVPKDLDLVL